MPDSQPQQPTLASSAARSQPAVRAPPSAGPRRAFPPPAPLRTRARRRCAPVLRGWSPSIRPAASAVHGAWGGNRIVVFFVIVSISTCSYGAMAAINAPSTSILVAVGNFGRRAGKSGLSSDVVGCMMLSCIVRVQSAAARMSSARGGMHGNASWAGWGYARFGAKLAVTGSWHFGCERMHSSIIDISLGKSSWPLSVY